MKDNQYRYKGTVDVPVLGMVDDQIGISKCGLDSALTTAHLNAQTNVKKLQFGANKCNKMHIGKKNHLCPDNTIDTWELVPAHEKCYFYFGDG